MPAATEGTAILQTIYPRTHEDPRKSWERPEPGVSGPWPRFGADPGAEGDGAGHDRDRVRPNRCETATPIRSAVPAPGLSQPRASRQLRCVVQGLPVRSTPPLRIRFQSSAVYATISTFWLARASARSWSSTSDHACIILTRSVQYSPRAYIRRTAFASTWASCRSIASGVQLRDSFSSVLAIARNPCVVIRPPP